MIQYLHRFIQKMVATDNVGNASPASDALRSDHVRLFAVSDIHTDMEPNLQWIQSISDTKYRNDALIVAGDVSDSLDILEVTLSSLQKKFGSVFFVAGNHDLWVSEEHDPPEVTHSIKKLECILQLCEGLGVITEARRIGSSCGDPKKSCWICPILSFHHQSFDTEPDLAGWQIPPVDQCMSDYVRCRFPAGTSMFDDSAAKRVDSINESKARFQFLRHRQEGETLVTFSHFLPRLELLLEKRFLSIPCLPKASGSSYLGKRVKDLAPDVHVFGHTHFGWDAVHDGVRYVQAALGYPHERAARWPSMSNANFNEEGSSPLLIWCSEEGFAPKSKCRWSGYYEHHPREPHKVYELASYAARSFRQIDDRATECMPDFSFWEDSEASRR
eukprot:TRINITY_DN13909_c0_g2_i2.p1 TRINITY_DN13909_c0_g2~~TRINITY_DN13909_c0_g2_i2.p1  ORF type:complete len:387 (-),score=55.38 TRINITY_DN13909_c0_g2_i2:194-1354(-)